MSRPRRIDYIAFERDHIPPEAIIAECRTGQDPSAWVSTQSVNIFRQTRGEKAHEGLDDLIRALRIGDTISIIQPPTVGLFTLNAAKRYLQDLNACWKTDYDYASCNLLPGSNTYNMAAIIAGHRRTLASVAVAQAITGLEKPDLWIPVQHQVDPSFYDGLRTQFQENSHKQVPLWDEADSIAATVHWGRRTGKMHTYADVASYLGITPERVSNAVSFDALPDEIKARVKHGSLTQESAILIERIGAASGIRMLTGQISPEDLNLYKSKLLKRTLRVDELRPYIEQFGLMELWKAELNAELTRLLAKEKQSNYVNARVRELVGDGELGLSYEGGVDPQDEVVSKLLYDRKTLQPLVVRSLRILLSALTADAMRLRFAMDHPERVNDSSLLATPIIANSPYSKRTWESIVSAMDIIASTGSSDSSILVALDRLAGNLTLLASELALENAVQGRAKELIELLENFKWILQADGGASGGVGQELVTSIGVLSQAILGATNSDSGGLF